ncbi:hypothetical protein [Prevotella merdae]|uniref:hypothetical protein n=1 Tax=Prevotella merdae TaxID=2079531 RepID=UPI003567F867
MKKQYIKPSVLVLALDVETILAGSETIVKNSNSDEEKPSSAALAPAFRGSLWDDEE